MRTWHFAGIMHCHARRTGRGVADFRLIQPLIAVADMLPITGPGLPLQSQMEFICDALAADFSLDQHYRASYLNMSGAENHPSRFVRGMGGGLQGAFYESGAQTALAHKLVTLGREMFAADTFDWRPNGGTAAAQAVLLGCCSRGDGFVHFSGSDGGQASLDAMARKVGVEVHSLPVQAGSLLVDVALLAQLVRENANIRLVLLDQSHKLRWQPLAEIRAVLPPAVVLAYDASQDGSLIIGGVVPQPLLSGADILLGNTHNTIPGPQKGYVAFANGEHPLVGPVSNALCPGLQENCHSESIAPFYLALLEMQIFGHSYAELLLCNARALAAGLYAEGLRVSGRSFGFTETNQVHVTIGSAQQARSMVSESLSRAGVRCDCIEIAGAGEHGLRLGVQALTRRGVDESGMAQIARLIADVVVRQERGDVVQHEVANFLLAYPLDLLHFSLDAHYETPYGLRLREEANA